MQQVAIALIILFIASTAGQSIIIIYYCLICENLHQRKFHTIYGIQVSVVYKINATYLDITHSYTIAMQIGGVHL